MYKILIVEDDPITAKVYMGQLRRAGFTVEWASSGTEGVGVLDRFTPDGMLVDFLMPGMNGLEFIWTVRARPEFQSVPIIVFSNAILPMVVEQLLACGVRHVFDKADLTPYEVVQAFRSAGLSVEWEEPAAGC